MNATDLDRIEAQLDIQLPTAYRSLLAAFPIAALAGNSDTYLWDCADALIEENLELRSGRHGVVPWPDHAFCLGRAGGGDVYAMDLRSKDASVVWVDHSHYDAIEGYPAEPFAAWAERYILDLRRDLECDGVDPTSNPEEREDVMARNARSGLWTLVRLAILGAGLLALVQMAVGMFGSPSH